MLCTSLGSSRTSMDRKLTRPRYFSATEFRASCVGRQFAPRVNQKDSTSGRLNRSHTRIAFDGGNGIWHADGRLEPVGHGFSEVEQLSWAMFASLFSGPVSAFGTANSESGTPRPSPLTPSVPPLWVRIVLRVATTMSTRKAIPTKVE